MQYPLLKTPVYDKMIADFSMTYKEFKDKYPRILQGYQRLPIADTEQVVVLAGKIHLLPEEDLVKNHPYSYHKANELYGKMFPRYIIPQFLGGSSEEAAYTVTTPKPTQEILHSFKMREILMNYLDLMSEKTNEWKGGKRKTRRAKRTY